MKNQLFNEISNNISSCNKCSLYKTRTLPVPGEGSINARIFFIGEGPGKQEDLTGRPFVGAAGKFLDELLTGIDLKREDVFIGNIVKCRPPNNRVPLPLEVDACKPYLIAQIALVQPEVICTLGNTPLKTLISSELSIGKIHGTVIKKDGFTFMPMYHPAAVLYHGALKGTLKEDFDKLKDFLRNRE
ncbi:MAG: uracil-DNA glycosylase [Caldisericaceae bacterium]|nr:uracil-DNA glycosylase [Caldisericaceae bacterium]